VAGLVGPDAGQDHRRLLDRVGRAATDEPRPEDLRPIEQARSFKALMATRGLSTRQLAERLRLGQATLAKALALLNLPGEIQEAVDSGEIAAGTAYQLTKVEDPAEQAELAREAASGHLRRLRESAD
jgi:ParB family chromosome partitioning protein